jgi:hypothetical protein
VNAGLRETFEQHFENDPLPRVTAVYDFNLFQMCPIPQAEELQPLHDQLNMPQTLGKKVQSKYSVSRGTFQYKIFSQ